MTQQDADHHIHVDVEAIIAAGKAAHEAELLREERARLRPSPLENFSRYDFWKGEYDLVDFHWVSLDDELTSFCRRYAAMDEQARSDIRRFLTFADHIVLQHFSGRCAVMAMRERQSARLLDGLLAISMFESSRIDPRDVLFTLDTLFKSAQWMGIDPPEFFQPAFQFAETDLAGKLATFFRNPKHLASFSPIIVTRDGPGIIQSRYRPYHPTCPLDRIVIDLAHLIKSDKYQPEHTTIAADLPKIWLSKVDDEKLNLALRTSVAGAIVTGCLRPESSPENEPNPMMAQRLMIFLVELAYESSAEKLLQLSKAKAERGTEFGMMGISQGRLFCLTIGKSMVQGRPSFETAESITRFAAGIAAILEKHCSAQSIR